jgi:hypothetical protein
MPDIGTVHLESDHGMAWLLRSNFISPSKIIFDIASLASVEISSGADVKYKNRTMGYLQDARYNKVDGYLVVFFNVTVGLQYLPEPQYLFASPIFKIHTIQCPICLSIFKPGAEPCACILTAPVLQMPRIILDGGGVSVGELTPGIGSTCAATDEDDNTRTVDCPIRVG